MKFFLAFLSYLLCTLPLASAFAQRCKCTPDSACWPTEAEWSYLNFTLKGALIRGVPPGSVCYSDQPNYSDEACKFVSSQWHNSEWHATDPVSVEYSIWTNNSCNPIPLDGPSYVTPGADGCSIGAYPAYVVNATTPEQVSFALRWASRKNLRIIIKNTGLSYAGRSIGYGSFSIWTHHLRGIEYIEDFRPTSCPFDGYLSAARVAAGHTGRDVQNELGKQNISIVSSGYGHVGLVGWLTGGGYGMYSQEYGMGADNLLEATIVTTGGKILVANPCQNRDLFFAIRGGGGGTYGVVTEVVVKAFITPKTTAHTFTLLLSNPMVSTDFWDAVGFLHAEMPRLKEGGMQGFYSITGPPNRETFSFRWAFFLHNKPDGTVEKLMAPIKKYLSYREHLLTYEMRVSDANASAWGNWGIEEQGRGGFTIGSRLLSPRSLSDPFVTAQALATLWRSSNPLKIGNPGSDTWFMGHLVAHPNAPTYYPNFISMNPAWRNTLVHFVTFQGWEADTLPEHIELVYEAMTYNEVYALRHLSPETGTYFNEADPYEQINSYGSALEWQQAFFGANYDRLRNIKRTYDTSNNLWCRRCVGSEDFVERADGKLCGV